MIQIENPLGTVKISSAYFSNLIGYAASECFGVVGMADATRLPNGRSLVARKERLDRGVKVTSTKEGLVVDLHIIVSYGVNVTAIVKNIIDKVRYTVQEATGLEIKQVNVYVDDMVS